MEKAPEMVQLGHMQMPQDTIQQEYAPPLKALPSSIHPLNVVHLGRSSTLVRSGNVPPPLTLRVSQ